MAKDKLIGDNVIQCDDQVTVTSYVNSDFIKVFKWGKVVFMTVSVQTKSQIPTYTNFLNLGSNVRNSKARQIRTVGAVMGTGATYPIEVMIHSDSSYGIRSGGVVIPSGIYLSFSVCYLTA